ncbi:MAG: ribosome recycling factor [Eubacteriales bacterium]|jgi:ribosome recycling factor|nr:ribosome recycling factor [Eubacteriales bacterium]
MKLVTKEYENKMKKSLTVYENELSAIRAGRANPAVLDKISVDYYGAPTAINQIATIRVSDARTIAIQPFKASDLRAIEKAINASDLGMPPQNDGKMLRLIFPQLTEERRRDLTKQIDKMGEEAKVALRNIRREANDKCKEMKKNKEMTEDEQKVSEKSIQELTDKYTKELDKITAAKNKEILTI